MDERAFEELTRHWQRSDARADERHRALLERQERSERLFVSTLGDIDLTIQRNTEGLHELSGAMGDMKGAIGDMRDAIADMREAIQADTRAVLSALDRLEPRSG